MSADPTLNELVATGKSHTDHSPMRALRELSASVSYCDGYLIRLGPDQNAYLYRLLQDTILFNTGGDRPRNRSESLEP